MTVEFAYWAQALDNTAPDQIEQAGAELPAVEIAKREAVVSSVSRVIKAGSVIFVDRGMKLSEDGRHFVLEVPSVQRDALGRTAPIVCHGPIPLKMDSAFGSTIASGVEGFAKRIGRTVAPEYLNTISKAFGELKKKSSNARRLRGVAIIALILAIIAIGYAIVSRVRSGS